MLAVLLLYRPQQAARLVEIAVIRPAVQRGEALLPAIGAAAAVGGAISACRMPRHADEERTVMAVICRPPWLAVGHQRVEIIFQRLVIERIEGLGIIEIIAHRVRWTIGVEDFGCQHFRPPILVGTSQKRPHAAVAMHRATAHFACLRIHRSSLHSTRLRVISWRKDAPSVLMRPID